MAKGKPTLPQVIENAKAVYAKTNNFAEAARQTDLPRTTAFEVIKDTDDFEQLRTEIRLKFIKEAIEPLMSLVALTNKKVKELSLSDNLFLTNLRELTGAIKDIKTSIENVGNTIVMGDVNNTQVNITQTDREEFDHIQEILKIVGDMSLEELKSKLET
jgi:hypothetical protein